MAYKDKEKQKQANREAAQRRRDKAKGMTKGMTGLGYDAPGMMQAETVKRMTKPDNYGEPDCKCQHCKSVRLNGNKHTINHGPWKHANQLATGEYNRVSLPGDIDYKG